MRARSIPDVSDEIGTRPGAGSHPLGESAQRGVQTRGPYARAGGAGRGPIRAPVGLRRRVVVVALFLLLCFPVLAGRLLYVQLGRGAELREWAEATRLRELTVKAKRGAIVDRFGRPLAVSVHADSVYAHPAQVREDAAKLGFGVADVARRLAGALELDPARTLNRLSQGGPFVYIKRRVPPEQAERVRELIRAGKLPGVGLLPEGHRVYVKGRMAAHVIGIAGDDEGQEGLEKVYEKELRGEDGRVQVEADGRGRPLGAPAAPASPRDGNTLVLTIDEAMQDICQRSVEQAKAETRAARVGIIAMEPGTGAIRCMAMMPDYDPGRHNDSPPEAWRPWMVTDAIEPGSMFKPIVAAAAIEERVVDPKAPFPAPASMTIQGRTFWNWDFKPVSGTLLDILTRSSNTGMAMLGLRLGVDRFYGYLERFGLREPTGIDLPGEATGVFPDPARASQLDLAVMSFGQTLKVTPLQALRAVAALASGGRLMQPYLVEEIRSPDGKTIWQHRAQSGGQAVSPETARTVADLLERVVAEGAGNQARVPGYRVAGKTGTAEKLPRGSGKYTADFVGFAPVDDPKLAIVIVIDEPQGKYYGGQVAAPVFSRIVGDLLRYLDVPVALPIASHAGGGGEPQTPSSSGTGAADAPGPARETAGPAPDASSASAARGGQGATPPAKRPAPALALLSPADAERIARDWGWRLAVEGVAPGGESKPAGVVVAQSPAPGTDWRPGGVIRVRLGPAPPELRGEGTVVVPNLIGKTMREAAELLADRELLISPSHTGIAASQNPLPGVRVATGTYVKVEFQPPR